MDLSIDCSELDSPADWRVHRRRRLEPHVIPVGTLVSLKVSSGVGVAEANCVVEETDVVSDHQVSQVVPQSFVYFEALLLGFLLDVFEDALVEGVFLVVVQI